MTCPPCAVYQVVAVLLIAAAWIVYHFREALSAVLKPDSEKKAIKPQSF